MIPVLFFEINLNAMININAIKVTAFYGYRQARVIPYEVKISLDDRDYRRLAKMLRDNGYDIDNHIVFCSETTNYWYSDNTLYIGGKLLIEDW